MNKTAIIMCQWERHSQFKNTISDLNKQSNKDFDLFVWNNKDGLNQNTILEFYADQSNGYKVYLLNHRVNVKGLARMIMANMLMNNKFPTIDNYDKIIFIDDDQRLESEFVQYMNDNYKEKSYISRWSYKIHAGDYWNRTRVNSNDIADYVGTCGAIIDPSIFKTDDFLKTYNYASDVYYLEDLALTLYCKKIGWKTLGLDDKYILTVEDGKDQCLIPVGNIHPTQAKRDGYTKLLKHYGFNLEISI